MKIVGVRAHQVAHLDHVGREKRLSNPLSGLSIRLA